jgi:galactitol-specific phosphotransferase system IIB component
MKKIDILKGTCILSCFLIIFMLNTPVFGQNDIIRVTRDLPAFDQINAGGAFEVTITIGESQKVDVEAKQQAIDEIKTDVKDNKLIITSNRINGNTPLKVFITVPALSLIEAHGAANIKGENTIKADMFAIVASGAASVKLDLDVNTLRSDISGAADIDLSGKAQQHSTVVSGAATLNAKKLVTITTDADVSGAGTANVNAGNVTGKTSGAGDIHTTEGEWTKENRDDVVVKSDNDRDTTYIHIPGTGVEITEGDDSVKVKVGNRVIVINDDGEIKTRCCHEPKFNGHWAGVDIGFNGYVNKDFNMNFPKEYEYLDLRMEKSVAVNLNFFEQNIPLSKNQKWGIVTGLGLGFNNYKFLRPTRLGMDSTALEGYLTEDISIRKSKLTAMYLMLPVLFEFQTAPCYHMNGFHINMGVVIGARLSSHTKVYYNELNTPFNITQYNPETGRYEVVFTSVSPNDPKEHNYGDWFLQPFKFDASVRIGWNFLNFWADYSLNTMFRQGRGPVLYPWSAGITLVCF